MHASDVTFVSKRKSAKLREVLEKFAADGRGCAKPAHSDGVALCELHLNAPIALHGGEAATTEDVQSHSKEQHEDGST